MIKIFKDC